jgi:hypothetical protein
MVISTTAIHFLKDGGWRPISLCDVAAMVEAATEDFDWDLCMGDEPIVAGWIGAAIGLTHEILDANVDAVPERYLVSKLPEWLFATVAREWEAPFVSRVRRPPLSRVFRRP